MLKGLVIDHEPSEAVLTTQNQTVAESIVNAITNSAMYLPEMHGLLQSVLKSACEQNMYKYVVLTLSLKEALALKNESYDTGDMLDVRTVTCGDGRDEFLSITQPARNQAVSRVLFGVVIVLAQDVFAYGFPRHVFGDCELVPSSENKGLTYFFEQHRNMKDSVSVGMNYARGQDRITKEMIEELVFTPRSKLKGHPNNDYLRRRCNQCARVGMKLSRCPCKITFYCNAKCQLAHWNTHKKECAHNSK